MMVTLARSKQGGEGEEQDDMDGNIKMKHLEINGPGDEIICDSPIITSLVRVVLSHNGDGDNNFGDDGFGDVEGAIIEKALHDVDTSGTHESKLVVTVVSDTQNIQDPVFEEIKLTPLPPSGLMSSKKYFKCVNPSKVEGGLKILLEFRNKKGGHCSSTNCLESKMSAEIGEKLEHTFDLGSDKIDLIVKGGFSSNYIELKDKLNPKVEEVFLDNDDKDIISLDLEINGPGDEIICDSPIITSLVRVILSHNGDGDNNLGDDGFGDVEGAVIEKALHDVDTSDDEEHELGDLDEPPKYKATLSDPKYDKWIDAMNAKMLSIKDNKACVLSIFLLLVELLGVNGFLRKRLTWIAITWKIFGGNTRDLGSILKETGQDYNSTPKSKKKMLTDCGDASGLLATLFGFTSDCVRTLTTASERSRPKETLEDSASQDK
nr:hypothetical protein [Tanacetum cinerariifolium]